MKKISILLMLMALVWACTPQEEIIPNSPATNLASDYSADFLRDWFKLECRVVKETPGFLPPQAARAFGYTGITTYEAVYRGIPNAKSLAGQLNGLSPADMPQADALSIRYHWGIVANAAVAEMMRLQFGKNLSEKNLTTINEKEAGYHTQFAPDAASKLVANLSQQLGKDIALAIFEYSKEDGGHEAYLNPFSKPYIPVTGDGKWVPTDANNLTPMSPHWKKCRPMLASNMAFAAPVSPIAFSTSSQSDFYKAAMQVYTIVSRKSAEEQEIARFWADDPFATCTPTGHTFNILTQLLEETGATLEKSAVGYGMLGVAENDAFITCWKVKYDFNLIRPVSYIQKYIDPAFKTVIGTPPSRPTPQVTRPKPLWASGCSSSCSPTATACTRSRTGRNYSTASRCGSSTISNKCRKSALTPGFTVESIITWTISWAYS
ncbi:hypothetical protein [Salmonirosea aquatica]|uniref:Phosphoesterase PA-phosphatase n=1 Tax=Salmonirosea aquatica TaxID=2654236 RepID=A0A7C9FD20_9BACT|nr:hypothetical protein [Cytophagaceae bacterium SJW1-29]